MACEEEICSIERLCLHNLYSSSCQHVILSLFLDVSIIFGELRVQFRKLVKKLPIFISLFPSDNQLSGDEIFQTYDISYTNRNQRTQGSVQYAKHLDAGHPQVKNMGVKLCNSKMRHFFFKKIAVFATIFDHRRQKKQHT